jgi:hypothetical protein
MRGIFRRVLCAGFLIILVAAVKARHVHPAPPQFDQNTDPKTQRRPEGVWILTGKIGGKYPLRMEIHRNDNQISGRYRYVNRPKADYLTLQGVIDKSGAGELSEFVESKKTGTFKGAFTGDIIGQSGPTKFAGAWTNADASVTLEFRLTAEDAQKTELEDRVNIQGKLHILRQNPELPAPKNVSYSDIQEACCYFRQPLITGKQSPQVLDKIRKALEIKAVYDATIPSLIEQLHDIDDQGKRTPNLNGINIDYQVLYNENYILSFSYERFDEFPRPQTNSERRVFDLKTGNVIKAKDIFIPSSMPALARMVDRRFQEAIKSQLAEYKAENSAEEYNDLKSMLAGRSFSADLLDDFTLDGQGITFYYDYGVTAFYPIFDTEILTFDYEELKDHINPRGILGQFISKRGIQ